MGEKGQGIRAGVNK